MFISHTSELCRDRAAECDVYVLVAGFRYGSPVRERRTVSYTELEFEAVTELGKPRLVFLLDEAAEGPGGLFRDPSRSRRSLGHDHPEPLRTAANLAVDLLASGEHRAARELAESTLADCRRVLGDDHPDTVRANRLLAEVLRDASNDS